MRISKFSFILILLISCSSSEPGGQMMPEPVEAELRIDGGRTVERVGGELVFEVRASSVTEQVITFNYEINGISAEPNVDFSASSGQGMIDVGSRTTELRFPIIDDDIREIDEQAEVTISSAVGATIVVDKAIVTISDEDTGTVVGEDGYSTSESHYGYGLTWSDEYDGEVLDPNFYNFETGTGCPNLCGWGNNELQNYTAESENVRLEDGNLVINAIATGSSSYTSSRITTQDKFSFTYGRIDIRARLPFGQGIWPAIWMLGENITSVGWPACGEIDIMELVGHEPNLVHGTAHWGNSGGPSTFVTGTKAREEAFSEAFHVFTLDWSPDKLTWYLDEEKYHEIERSRVTNVTYPFSSNFFLIFNIAVGGNWPGKPDDTTTFPQAMEVDYVRVFQLN